MASNTDVASNTMLSFFHLYDEEMKLTCVQSMPL